MERGCLGPLPVRARPTYAVVPSMGRDCLAGCLESLLPQVEALFLIKTEDFTVPDVETRTADRLSVIDDLRRPKNISRWWNIGITAATAYARVFGQQEFNVLVVNDDIVAGDRLVEYLDRGMRGGLAASPVPVPPGVRPVLAYPDNWPPYNRATFHDTPGGVELSTRISGWCFMLRGEAGITADEQFEWFYGDDDLDWRCRREGGAVMVPGCPVEHLYPNELTSRSAELSARTHIDRQLFAAKWGALPH
jgi:hypothetical protein